MFDWARSNFKMHKPSLQPLVVDCICVFFARCRFSVQFCMQILQIRTTIVHCWWHFQDYVWLNSLGFQAAKITSAPCGRLQPGISTRCQFLVHFYMQFLRIGIRIVECLLRHVSNSLLMTVSKCRLIGLGQISAHFQARRIFRFAVKCMTSFLMIWVSPRSGIFL